MELDNFKELWNKDKNQLPELSLKKQNEIHSPLQMITINMKTEFWLMVVIIPTMVFGFPFTTDDYNIQMITIFVTVLMVAIIVYFYSRFLRLYKLLKKSSINTNYDLFNLRTQLLISKQIYISYYISYIPLAFLLSLIRINFHFNVDYNLAIFAISFLLTFLMLWFIIKYWTYYMYGRYIDDVVRLVDELNDIEVKPKIDIKKTWFECSQKFFINKYGIKGNVLNTILWFVVVYIFIIIFLTFVLYMIIILGDQLNFFDKTDIRKALKQLN